MIKFTKRKIIILSGCVIFAGMFYFLAPGAVKDLKWKMAADAAGSMPYQIGLTNAMIIPCFTTGIPPICNGGMLCYAKDAATCTLYSDVSGTPAGGMGSNALFLKTAIAQAGLTPGGQLIAGGTSMIFMESGVLASAGGCSGCVAKLDNNKSFAYKIFDWIDRMVIAGIKN